MTGDPPGTPTESNEDEAEERWLLSPAGYAFFCPECGASASATVLLDFTLTHHCGDCGTQWSRGDHENCVRCGKPLGGTDTICYTCRSNLEEASR